MASTKETPNENFISNAHKISYGTRSGLKRVLLEKQGKMII
jgi:hypothetical protein